MMKKKLFFIDCLPTKNPFINQVMHRTCSRILVGVFFFLIIIIYKPEFLFILFSFIVMLAQSASIQYQIKQLLFINHFEVIRDDH